MPRKKSIQRKNSLNEFLAIIYTYSIEIDPFEFGSCIGLFFTTGSRFF